MRRRRADGAQGGVPGVRKREYDGGMSLFDPFSLARAQLERDRARCARLPALVSRKIARMSASPFAFLRGAAPLFYQLCREHSVLGAGPPGEGWIAGDLHLENFGAFRTEPLGEEGHGDKKRAEVCFHINDFDDAAIGPRRLDLLRLCTSLLLAR